MNHVSIIGRLVRPIELQEVGTGRFVCNNTLAVQRIRKKDDGQQQADFIPIVVWDKTAHLLKQYCSKGTLLGVNGRMVSRSYVNKQNQRVYVVEMIVEEIHFIESKKKVEEAVEIPF